MTLLNLQFYICHSVIKVCVLTLLVADETQETNKRRDKKELEAVASKVHANGSATARQPNINCVGFQLS